MARSFLDGMEISVAEAQSIFKAASSFKTAMAARQPLPKPLADRSIGLFFEKQSTRTRTSFDTGIFRLGGHVVFLNPQDMQLAREEPLEDTARVLGGYLDALIMRTHAHSRLHKVAKHSGITVVNALCDDYHPCQILADLFSMQEKFGGLTGLPVAYAGDGNNVLHSLLLDCARHGVDFRFSVPGGFSPSPAVVERAKAQVAAGGGIREFKDPMEAVKDVKVIYTDVWFSMGDPDEKLAQRTAFEPFQLTHELMAQAAPDAVIMHCLPAHTGDEITLDLFDEKADFIFLQAHNRLQVQMALLVHLLA